MHHNIPPLIFHIQTESDLQVHQKDQFYLKYLPKPCQQLSSFPLFSNDFWITIWFSDNTCIFRWRCWKIESSSTKQRLKCLLWKVEEQYKELDLPLCFSNPGLVTTAGGTPGSITKSMKEEEGVPTSSLQWLHNECAVCGSAMHTQRDWFPQRCNKDTLPPVRYATYLSERTRGLPMGGDHDHGAYPPLILGRVWRSKLGYNVWGLMIFEKLGWG